MVIASPTKCLQQNLHQSAAEELPIKRPNCLRNAKCYFFEFCDNTSIHGLKFLGEKKRSWAEKVWWFVVVGVAFCGCILLITKTYQKWISSPVIVSFATSQTSIREIPFPAVTICPDVKAQVDIFNFTDVELRLLSGDNVTTDELYRFKRYNYLKMVCERDASFNKIEFKTVDKSALDFITDAAPTVNQIVLFVKWQGNTYEDVTQFFTPVLNSEGVCYTFNILDRKDLFKDTAALSKNFFSNGNSSTWTIETGFEKHSSKSYPRYSVVSGVDGGIDFLLATKDRDIDYRCSPSFLGFKITLQHPALIPKGRKSFFSVPLDQTVLASVKPIMMMTSDELRSYTPQKRQCFFMGEKRLRFYKGYNQPNCLMECLTNFTLETCGCVGFQMPMDNSTSVCGPGSKACTNKAKVLYLLAENNSKGSSKSYKDKCNCLPSCTSLDFEMEVSQSNWDWKKVHQTDGFAEGLHLSMLRIFFKDMQFITSVRNELYGTTDFLASCGGLLGLFMGFSAISLFEILYFLSLRFCCNVRNHGLRYWSGADELLEVEVRA